MIWKYLFCFLSLLASRADREAARHDWHRAIILERKSVGDLVSSRNTVIEGPWWADESLHGLCIHPKGKDSSYCLWLLNVKGKPRLFLMDMYEKWNGVNEEVRSDPLERTREP